VAARLAEYEGCHVKQVTFRVYYERRNADLGSLPAGIRGAMSGLGDVTADLTISRSGDFTKGDVEALAESLPSFAEGDYRAEMKVLSAPGGPHHRSLTAELLGQLTRPGPRLAGIVQWLQHDVWTPGRFAAVPPETYLAEGEQEVHAGDELLAAAAPRVYDELAAAAAPRLLGRLGSGEALAMLRGRLKDRPQGPAGARIYRHGGLSLMEMLVPWLVLEKENHR
jgi:hypothetical protein